MQRAASLSYRARVLAAINAAPGPLAGQDVARLAGIGYRQTVDALNALHNAGRITRIGRKFTARWSRLPDPPTETPGALLQRLMHRMITR
jgi:hypothetical protein